MLSEAVGDLKDNIGDIDLLCQESDFDVFQKGDSMCNSMQEALSKQYDHHPQASDGAMLNFDEQDALVHSIMAYGSVETCKL